MQPSCWQILNIEPTTDIKAIKQAYAKQLKHSKPSKDPKAFYVLREAYEEALSQCEFVNRDFSDDLVEHANLDLSGTQDVNLDDTKTQISDETIVVKADILNVDNSSQSLTEFQQSQWQQIWQKCHSQHDADKALYECLTEQFKSLEQLSLDERIDYEEDLLEWFDVHAPNYPVSFEFSTQMLNWREQAKQVQPKGTSWMYLPLLIDYYHQHNIQAYRTERAEYNHGSVDRTLNFCESCWDREKTSQGLLACIKWDVQSSQDFDDFENELFEKALLIWFSEQQTPLADEFFYAYWHFSWHERLYGYNRYSFPWSYLPELLQRYTPEFTIKNIYDFEHYMLGFHRDIFKQWYLDKGERVPTTIVNGSYYNDYQLGQKPKGATWYQSWRWHWQFFTQFKFVYPIYETVILIHRVEQGIEKYERLYANLENSNQPSSPPQVNKSITQYWFASKKINYLYLWLYTGFVDTKVIGFLAVLSMGLVIGVSAKFPEYLWHWQRIGLDSLGVFLLLSIALLFWQKQMTVMVDVHRFFQINDRVRRYTKWVVLTWMLSLGLQLVLQSSNFKAVSDKLSFISSYALLTADLLTISTLITCHLLGLASVLFLARCTKSMYMTVTTWYVSQMCLIVALISMAFWTNRLSKNLLILLLVWVMVSVALTLKIWANHQPFRLYLHTLAETVLFFVMLAMFWTVGITLVVTLGEYPSIIAQWSVSFAVLTLLILLWAYSLFRLLLVIKKHNDYNEMQKKLDLSNKY